LGKEGRSDGRGPRGETGQTTHHRTTSQLPPPHRFYMLRHIL